MKAAVTDNHHRIKIQLLQTSKHKLTLSFSYHNKTNFSDKKCNNFPIPFKD